MNPKAKPNLSAKTTSGIPFYLILVIPFVLQIFAAVGITGYLSFRNGQKAVRNLATQLEKEVSDRVTLHLDNYLNTAVTVNQINADAVKLGLLDLKDYQKAGYYCWKQLQIFKDVGYISYALPTGEYAGAGKLIEKNGINIDELSPDTNWQSYSYATDAQGQRTKIIDDAPRANASKFPKLDRKGD